MSSELYLFISITFITCITPGAGVLYTLSNAFRYGRGKAYLSPTGNAIGVAVMSLISAAGMGAVIAATPALFIGLQAIGALVLAWMGFKNWKAPAIDMSKLGKLKAQEDHLTGAHEKSRLEIVISAALLQVTNPMLIIFLLSLLPPFIHPDDDYVSRMALLLSLFVGICWLVHIGYSYLAALLGEHLHGTHFSWWLNKISALLFWLMALGVLIKLSRF